MSSSETESIDELQCLRCFTKFSGGRPLERLYAHDCPAVAKPKPVARPSMAVAVTNAIKVVLVFAIIGAVIVGGLQVVFQ